MESVEPPESSVQSVQSVPQGPPVKLDYANASLGRGRLSIRRDGGDLLIVCKIERAPAIAGCCLAVLMGLQGVYCLLAAARMAPELLSAPAGRGDRARWLEWLLLVLFFADGLWMEVLVLIIAAALPATSVRLRPCGLLVSSRPNLLRMRRRSWPCEQIAGVFVRRRRLRLRLRDGKEFALLPRCRPVEQEALGEALSAVEAWLRVRE